MKHRNATPRQKCGKTLAMMLSVLTLLSVSALPSSAATKEVLVGYRGDANCDNSVDIGDAIVLSKHLSTVETMSNQTGAMLVDMDESGALDAVDLTLLKRFLASNTEPVGIYETVTIPDEQTIDPPIKTLNPTLASTGNTRVPLFMISFPDCTFSESYTDEQLYDRIFGAENTSDNAFPYESITAYYQRASYGNLQLDGDIYRYTAQQPIAAYQEKVETLIKEVLRSFADTVDFTQYDSNDNHILDVSIYALPGSANMDYWWPCSGGFGDTSFKVDGLRVGNVCTGGWSLEDRSGFNSTWIHELGHSMGLPDYYKYYTTGDTQGLQGDAGYEMMDEATGDLCAFSKLMLGWYTPSQIAVYRGGTQSYTLQSSQVAPNCLIIPRGDPNSFSGDKMYFNEYMIVEYVTPIANYSNNWFRSGGIRILHVNATLQENYWGAVLAYENYGPLYDHSEEKQRVLRLVNNNGGFFNTGAVVNASTKGFAWYDSNGYETVNTNYTVTVGALQDGSYSITVSE